MMTSDPTLPADAPFIQTSTYIVRQEPVSSRYFRLELACKGIAERAKPGQFVMLACAPDASTDPLLPRPLAIMDADVKRGTIELLYFVAGRGTASLHEQAYLAGAGRDPRLRIIGPLGVGFEPVPGVAAHIGVGGGSGVAPLVFFMRGLASGKFGAFQSKHHLILGARSKDQLAREDVVAAPNTILHPATDDGSAGFKGHGVAALEALLDGPLKGVRAAIYAAGPELMMEGAARVARKRGLPSRVSLEARMACGVGVCRGCVVDGLAPHKKTGLKRRTICVDGPVFDPCELAGAWSE